MKKLIFIDGFWSRKNDKFLIRLFLRNDFEVIKFNYENSGKIKIEQLANQLKKFIDALILEEKEKVDILAFSMGGLIASYYGKFLDSKKIDKLITVFTPFYGSPWAEKFFPKREGINQMKRNSQFLKRLNKKQFGSIKHKSFWSRNDFLVGESAKFADSERFDFFFHPAALYWPPLIKKIKIELRK